jgi:hypothetical protein
MRRCSECGLDMDLVGLRHRCVPLPKPRPEITKPAEVITEPEITKEPMITKVRRGRRPIGERAMTAYERLKRHRAKRRGG